MENKQASQLTTGVLVIAIGVLLLAGQLDAGWHFGRLWPVILIVVGLGRYLSTGDDGQRGSGFWFLFLGGIFLLHNYHVLMLHQSWPLFIIAAGWLIIVGRQRDGGLHRSAADIRQDVKATVGDLRQDVRASVTDLTAEIKDRVDSLKGDGRHDQ